MGSDIVTVLYSGTTPVITDHWVDWYPFDPSTKQPSPSLSTDAVQSYSLVCASKTSTKLFAIVSRLLDTGDGQDRVILNKSLPVVFAWGLNAPVQYHGVNRGSSSINFLGVDSFAYPSDANGFMSKVYSAGFTLTTTSATQYICQAFDLGTTSRHVIAAEVILSGAAASYAHHMLLHACGSSTSSLVNNHLTGPYPCQIAFGTNDNAEGYSPLSSSSCKTLVYGWAKGGERMIVPSSAGIPIGSSSTRYVILEVHFNNPSLTSGINVQSVGVNLTTTSVLRTYNAGSLVAGDPTISITDSSLQSTRITAGQSSVAIETTCSSNCTKYFPITRNVFSSFLHMHSVGKKIWLTKKSSGVLTVLDFKQFWSFEFQTQSFSQYSIAAGDQLNLHCVYDASRYISDVEYGLASSDEMCMVFLMYYPVTLGDNTTCAYRKDETECGTNTIAETNPIPGEHTPNTADTHDPHECVCVCWVVDGTTDIPAALRFGLSSGIPVSTPPTIAPSKAPASSSDSSTTECFYAFDTVLLANGETRFMADLRVDDEIQSVDANMQVVFAKVLFIPHEPNTIKATFIHFTMELGNSIHVTPNHLLMKTSCVSNALSPTLVLASNVELNDCLITVHGKQRVMEKEEVMRRGLYTAITTVDYVVVNGVVASPFALNHHVPTAFYRLLSHLPLQFLAIATSVTRAVDVFGSLLASIV